MVPPAAATVVIGDSVVRNIKLYAAATYCVPGARVSDLLERIPALPIKHADAGKVVIHIGTNDIASQQSEVLKRDFNSLFNLLKNCRKSVFISGPLLSFHRGVGRFSRLLSLTTWLQSACSLHNLVLIDNFNLFWERAAFF
uniref:SGNH hydrolase-type esterase domain-containing protein n=1 Tax=Stegastes partitus TaxID=144197 RepID=A0A3B4ZB61_9TELE